MNETIGQKLQRLMKEKDITTWYQLQELTYDPNIKPSKLHQGYLKEVGLDITNPGPKNLTRIAKALGYKDASIFFIQNNQNQLSEPRAGYDSGKHETKQTVLQEVRKLLDKLDRQPEEELVEMPLGPMIPIVDEVSAGNGSIPKEHFPNPAPGSENIMLFKVKGLCMEPLINDGDELLIDKSKIPVNEDLVIVIIEDKGSVKRYKDDGKGHIRFENNYGSYMPETVKKIVGVVIKILKPPR